MKTSKITLPISGILFQNKHWSIELLADRAELAITNGYDVCYAYFDRDNQKMFYDRIICPRYIQEKALKLANASGMISIYSDNN